MFDAKIIKLISMWSRGLNKYTRDGNGVDFFVYFNFTSFEIRARSHHPAAVHASTPARFNRRKHILWREYSAFFLLLLLVASLFRAVIFAHI